MEIQRTGRGFSRGEFTDYYGEQCSIQQSSLACIDAIWLGVNNPTPKVLVPGTGWQTVSMPEGTLLSGRMHLTQEMCAELIPLLQRFVDTGLLAKKGGA